LDYVKFRSDFRAEATLSQKHFQIIESDKFQIRVDFVFYTIHGVQEESMWVQKEII